MGRPSSRYFAFIERLHFCSLSYDDYSNYFKGTMNVAMFVTMNADKGIYEQLYKEKFELYADEWKSMNGKVTLYPCYNTLQVKDYSKYNMGSFNEVDKKRVHEECFQTDLENAFNIGARLSL